MTTYSAVGEHVTWHKWCWISQEVLKLITAKTRRKFESLSPVDIYYRQDNFRTPLCS